MPWIDSIMHDASVFIGSASAAGEIMHNDSSTEKLALMAVSQVGGI